MAGGKTSLLNKLTMATTYENTNKAHAAEKGLPPKISAEPGTQFEGQVEPVKEMVAETGPHPKVRAGQSSKSIGKYGFVMVEKGSMVPRITHEAKREIRARMLELGMNDLLDWTPLNVRFEIPAANFVSHALCVKGLVDTGAVKQPIAENFLRTFLAGVDVDDLFRSVVIPKNIPERKAVVQKHEVSFQKLSAPAPQRREPFTVKVSVPELISRIESSVPVLFIDKKVERRWMDAVKVRAGGDVAAGLALIGSSSLSARIKPTDPGMCHLRVAREGTAARKSLELLGPWPKYADVEAIIRMTPRRDLADKFYIQISGRLIHFFDEPVARSLPSIPIEGIRSKLAAGEVYVVHRLVWAMGVGSRAYDLVSPVIDRVVNGNIVDLITAGPDAALRIVKGVASSVGLVNDPPQPFARDIIGPDVGFDSFDPWVGGFWDDVKSFAARKALEFAGTVIPDGKCYKLLISNDIDLGFYPRAQTLIDNPEFVYSLVANCDRQVYVTQTGGVMHISMTGTGTPVTVLQVYWLLQRKPEMVVGGTPKLGYCYQVLFPGRVVDFGRFPRIVDVFLNPYSTECHRRGKMLSYFYFKTGNNKYGHIGTDPILMETSGFFVLTDELYELFEGLRETVAGRPLVWWLEMRAGGEVNPYPLYWWTKFTNIGIGKRLFSLVLTVLLVYLVDRRVTFGVLACGLISSYVSNRVAGPPKPFKILTFGSYGDITPMRYYRKLLTEAGFDCTIDDVLTVSEGKDVLAALEDGKWYTLTPKLVKFIDALQSNRFDHTIIAPLGGMNLDDNIITFNLSPPLHTHGKFRVAVGDGPLDVVVNFFADLFATIAVPDFRIGAFAGCAPRSVDGIRPLVTRSNLGTRNTLVCTGSSSSAEPLDLDPLLTWSTNPESIYRFEDRTNHQEMFRDYVKVVTHGGAGTVQTARACGCEVTSISKLIDRDLVNFEGFQVNDDHTAFLLAILQHSNVFYWGTLLAKLSLKFTWFEVSSALFFASIGKVFTLMKVALVLGYCLIDRLANAAAAPDLASGLYEVIVTPAVSNWISLVLATVGSFSVRYFVNKGGPLTVFPGVVGVWVVCTEILTMASFWLILPLAGPFYAALFAYMVRYLYVDEVPKIMKAALQVWHSLVEHMVFDPSYLYLSMTRLNSMDTKYPLLHWELVDVTTNEAVGASVGDFARIVTYRGHCSNDVILRLKTSIPTTELGRVYDNLRCHEDSLYTPVNNCQTLLLPILFGSMSPLMTIFVTVSCVITVSTLGILGLLMVPMLLIFCLAWLGGVSDYITPFIVSARGVFFAAGGNPDFSDLYAKLVRLLPNSIKSLDQPQELVEKKLGLPFFPTAVRLPVDEIISPPLARFVKQEKEAVNIFVRLITGPHSDVPEMDDGVLNFTTETIVDRPDIVTVPFSKQLILAVIRDKVIKGRRIVAFDGDKLDLADAQAAAVDPSISKKSVGGLIRGQRGLEVVITPLKPSTSRIVVELDRATDLSKSVKVFWKLVPVFSRWFIGSSAPVNFLWSSFCSNAYGFCKRLVLVQRRYLDNSKSLEAIKGIAPILLAIDEFLEYFQPELRSSKPVWAPVMDKVPVPRCDELGVVINETARFDNPGYERTLSHYIAALNEYRPAHMKWKGEKLSINEFTREVNRNPHIDLVLKQRYAAHDVVEAIDGQVLACKEVMIATLARYVESNVIDALLDHQKDEVARSIVNANPELYLNARLASPKRLLNHWMKHPSYSAGLPFIGKGSSYRDRKSVKSAGWFKALEKIAVLPLVTGVWFPSIAHAFSKSQVIEASKLRANPAKLRSVTATSIITNLQKGVLNFDVNNRHDFVSAPGKPGIPLTGYHLGKQFEALDRYKYKASADITAMDSNLSSLVFEIQARIRKIGYESMPFASELSNHIDAMMLSTQQGYIVNLISTPASEAYALLDKDSKGFWDSIPEESWELVRSLADDAKANVYNSAPGGVVSKLRGGYTGDSDTTWTNTVGLQIILFCVFNDVFGIPFDKILDEIFLANFGDDNILGLNIEDVDFDLVKRRAKEMFGVDLRFEGLGGTLDQSFLGKLPLDPEPFADEFEQFQVKMPKYAIVHNRKMLLARYVNFKAEASRHFKRGKSDAMYDYLVRHGNGYLQLTAHQKDIYNDISSDVDKWRMKIRNKRRRKANVLKSPTYEKIFKDWYKAEDYTGSTLLQLNIEQSWYSRSTVGFLTALDSFDALMNSVPTHLVMLDDQEKMALDLELASDYIFEDHAWHSFVHEIGKIPSHVELDMMLRQTPYYAFTSPRSYLADIVPGLVDCGPEFEVNRLAAQTRVIVFSAIYTQTNRILGLLNHLPVGNIVLGIFNLYTKSLPQLYALLNYVHYLARARSSGTISRLMPKDLYHNHKALSVIIMQVFPRGSIISPLDVSLILSALDRVSVTISKLANFTIGAPRKTYTSGSSGTKAWARAACEALEVIDEGKIPIISAPTGTGKTRYFPGELLQACVALNSVRRIVIAMPRKILCEGAAQGGTVYKKAGIRWPEQGITVCTYGHLMMQYISGGLKQLMDDTIFILDECHETACEIQFIKSVLKGTCKVVAMTATPAAEDPKLTTIIEVDIKRKFEVKWYKASGYNAPELFCTVVNASDRILIIDPRIRTCEKIANTLTAQGFKVKVVSSKDRAIPADLSVHLVATSIVDAGINIEGVTKVLDTGYRLADHKGSLVAKKVNMSVATQRAGRTGRFCNGSYYLMNDIEEFEYKPAPSIDQVLADAPIATFMKVKCRLDLMPLSDPRRVIGNNYALFTHQPKSRKEEFSLSLYHSLTLTARDVFSANEIYKKTSLGFHAEEAEFFMSSNQLSFTDLFPLPDVLELIKSNPIRYSDGRALKTGKPSVLDNRVVIDLSRNPPTFSPNLEKGDRFIEELLP